MAIVNPKILITLIVMLAPLEVFCQEAIDRIIETTCDCIARIEFETPKEKRNQEIQECVNNSFKVHNVRLYIDREVYKKENPGTSNEEFEKYVIGEVIRRMRSECWVLNQAKTSDIDHEMTLPEMISASCECLTTIGETEPLVENQGGIAECLGQYYSSKSKLANDERELYKSQFPESTDVDFDEYFATKFTQALIQECPRFLEMVTGIQSSSPGVSESNYVKSAAGEICECLSVNPSTESFQRCLALQAQTPAFQNEVSANPDIGAHIVIYVAKTCEQFLVFAVELGLKN